MSLYDDIISNNTLSREQKAEAIKQRGAEELAQIEAEKRKNMRDIWTKGAAGAALMGASMLPVFNIPYVGTGIGGAMFSAGDSIAKGEKLKDITKNAGTGFLIGETVGAVPYVGKLASKTKTGQAVAKQTSNLFQKIAEKPIVQKAEDVLMTDIKAFNPNKQTAFHGSPYDFNKFSNEAIGTGEGAQAHGMGHYTALNKDVAQRYKETLAEGSPLYEEYKSLTDYRNLLNQLNERRPLNDTLKNALKDTETKIYEIEKNNLPSEYLEKKGGQLYKLSVPKDDVMLREDLRFSEQPKAVQDSLENYFKDLVELNEGGYQAGKTVVAPGSEEQLLRDYIYNNGEGSSLGIYRGLADRKKTFHELHKDPISSNYAQQQITNDLSDYGIKGISYNGGIDGEARVIFNPDDIDIVRKYYNQPNLWQYITGKNNIGTDANILYNSIRQ